MGKAGGFSSGGDLEREADRQNMQRGSMGTANLDMKHDLRPWFVEEGMVVEIDLTLNMGTHLVETLQKIIGRL